jgi:hypothetical protein
MNRSVVVLTDRGEEIRNLPCFLKPHSEHYLNWFT